MARNPLGSTPSISGSAFAKATELQQRLWFTLGALLVYRLGTYIPVPGIDPAALSDLFNDNSGGLLGMFNMMAGGALGRMTIFALSTPYGRSAVAMIRLSGPNSLNIAKTITKKNRFPHRQANFVTFFDNKGYIIDRGLLIFFKSPSSCGAICFFIFFKLKKSFFCAVVVPIFTKLHDLNIYSCIDALIHHIA